MMAATIIYADTATELQAELTPTQWRKVNDLLIAQRTELTTSCEATIAKMAQLNEAKLANEKAMYAAEAKAEAESKVAESLQKAEAAKKEAEKKISDLLQGANDALALPTTQQRITAALALIEQAKKTAAQQEADRLETLIAEQQKKLAELQAQQK